MQSLALAGAAYGTVKKKKKKRLVKSAVDIIVGTEIIKATSKSI